MSIAIIREKEQQRFAAGECGFAASCDEEKPLGFVSWRAF